MANSLYKRLMLKALDNMDGPSQGYLGPSPYTESGYRRDPNPIVGLTYDPIGAKTYSANQDQYNLNTKEQALGLPPADQPWWSKAWGKLGELGRWGVASPAGRGALWILDKMDRPVNALEGALENTRDKALSAPNGLGAMDTLRAAGQGAWSGLKGEKDWSFARWLTKLAPDSQGWQDAMQARPFRLIHGLMSSTDNFENQTTDQMRGRSGPQTDPEYSGMSNATVADILGSILNFKAAVMPMKLGRIPVNAGATEVVDEAATQAAKAAAQAPMKFRIPMQRGLPGGSFQTLMDATPRAFNLAEDGTKLLSRVPTAAREVDPIMKTIVSDSPQLRRVLQLDLLGHTYTPFQATQLKVGDMLGQGTRGILSKAPAAERFLSHLSNRVESSSTQGASKMFDVIDNARQGYRVANRNFDERMAQSIDAVTRGTGKLSDAQRTLAYYATVTGKAMDDPSLLTALEKHYGFSAAELGQSAKDLEGLRQWWLPEAEAFKTTGESKGLFKGLNTDYMPIRFKKDLSQPWTVDSEQLFGQEFGGLRGIQKHRGMNLTKDWEKLIEAGSKGELAFDKFDQAASFYSKVFHNLEKRRNTLSGLENLGIVSRKAQTGFDPMATILDVNPQMRTQQGLAAVLPEEYFINSRLKQRFIDEVFGYGGGGGTNKLLQGLAKAQDPWKLAVTTLNPKYHINNFIDDTVRNFALGDVTPNDLRAAVTRGTGEFANGAVVRDWSLSPHGQWEYSPGTKAAMNLTEEQASSLAQAMGISTVQTSEIGKFATDQSMWGRFKGGVNTLKDTLERAQGVQREANFMANLRRSGDSAIAQGIVNQDLINYRDITPFMRDIVRPFSPFATFRVKNPVVSLNQMLMNPTWFGRLAMAQKAAQGGDQNLNLPEYYRDKPVIAWKDQSTGKTHVLDLGLSQWDWQNMVPGERMMESVRKAPGPAFQLPFGLLSGKDSLGNSIVGPKESNWIDGLLFGQKGADGKTYTDGQKKFIIDTLLGQVASYHKMGETTKESLGRQINSVRTFNSDAELLRLLLEQNRIRQQRLDDLSRMGAYIPSAGVLRKSDSWLR